MENMATAIENFRKAFSALSEILLESDEETVNSVICGHYPFEHDLMAAVHDVHDFCDALAENIGKIKATNPVEVFYTGGGIWLAAKYVDDRHYYVLDNDFYGLGYYDHTQEDDDLDFPCQNMIDSWDCEDLPETIKPIYQELHDALLRDMN